MPEPEEPSPWRYDNFARSLFKIVDGPVTLFRENVVEPIRSKNKLYYYHRKYRRVPTVDECEVGSQTCLFEANEQFKRDKSVDSEILAILMDRRLECMTYYGTEADKYCQEVQKDHEGAVTNWFTKYGDLGPAGNVLDAYNKQKNRLLWERRHGPVGTGMKKREV